MSRWLRLLGAAVLLAGLATAAGAAWAVLQDTAYAEAAAAYARHPGHPLFQADYYLAAARYWGLAALALGGLLGGLIAGSTLLGLGDVLRRLPER